VPPVTLWAPEKRVPGLYLAAITVVVLVAVLVAILVAVLIVVLGTVAVLIIHNILPSSLVFAVFRFHSILIFSGFILGLKYKTYK